MRLRMAAMLLVRMTVRVVVVVAVAMRVRAAVRMAVRRAVRMGVFVGMEGMPLDLRFALVASASRTHRSFPFLSSPFSAVGDADPLR